MAHGPDQRRGAVDNLCDGIVVVRRSYVISTGTDFRRTVVVEMNSNNEKFKLCMDCIHFVTPTHSMAECHAPGVPDGILSMQCRDTGGLCGPLAKLWEKNNESLG